ncbi:hypothetical protein M378DRAFT_178232 [Amanita muscaria Koide BX008]|uniref:Uncharacterized protein n=1 Tax=Amanita muscaria (strain Koide BX008) TaxID=946122 RepID=A0A0C2X900_AMAMK|nr:hypothetical protein M378DRAFT_178232 [Amanita muscaria Koide BX008]
MYDMLDAIAERYSSTTDKFGNSHLVASGYIIIECSFTGCISLAGKIRDDVNACEDHCDDVEMFDATSDHYSNDLNDYDATTLSRPFYGHEGVLQTSDGGFSDELNYKWTYVTECGGIHQSGSHSQPSIVPAKVRKRVTMVMEAVEIPPTKLITTKYHPSLQTTQCIDSDEKWHLASRSEMSKSGPSTSRIDSKLATETEEEGEATMRFFTATEPPGYVQEISYDARYQNSQHRFFDSLFHPSFDRNARP